MSQCHTKGEGRTAVLLQLSCDVCLRPRVYSSELPNRDRWRAVKNGPRSVYLLTAASAVRRSRRKRRRLPGDAGGLSTEKGELKLRTEASQQELTMVQAN